MGKGKKIRTQILRIIVTVNSHHTGAYAAQAAYFFVLSLIPIFLLLLTMVQFTPVTMNDVMEAVLQVFPESVTPMIRSIVIQVYTQSGTVIPVTVIVALSLGLVLGASAGYFGGKADMVIMRIMDIFLAIPGTLLAICIVASLGNSIPNLVIAQAIASTPTFARVVRGAVLTVRGADYVEAARAIGAKDATIIFHDVLPNSLAPIIVQTTLQVASVILSIAGLSFLGLGIPAPTPEWGAMLSAARSYIRDYSYMCMFPGCAIMITILALNLLGDGLRDALDPRLR